MDIMTAIPESHFFGGAFYLAVSKPLYLLRSAKLRKWRYASLDLCIQPGVFHPRDKRASTFVLDFMKSMNLKGLRLLELGCGSASIACLAATKGARVHASDIVETACRNAEINARRNEVDIAVHHSDLFEGIPKKTAFDLVVSVPPLVPRYPEDDLDFTYCCGERLEFFIGLFEGLTDHLAPQGRLIMPLPNNRFGGEVLGIAHERGFAHSALRSMATLLSSNTIYGFSAEGS